MIKEQFKNLKESELWENTIDGGELLNVIDVFHDSNVGSHSEVRVFISYRKKEVKEWYKLVKFILCQDTFGDYYWSRDVICEGGLISIMAIIVDRI